MLREMVSILIFDGLNKSILFYCLKEKKPTRPSTVLKESKAKKGKGVLKTKNISKGIKF